MADYIISKKTADDLRKIWNNTAEAWSEKQADTYYNSLIQSFDYIADNPLSAGHTYDHVKPWLRGTLSNQHIVFYRVLGNGKVRIIRILHCRMDIGTKF